MEVPRYSPQADLAALPGARVNVNAPVEAFGGAQARGLVEMAGGLERVGESAATVAHFINRESAKAQAEADALRVSDGLNAVKERINDLTFKPGEGFTGVLGKDAIERPGGVALADDYRDRLNETIGQVSQGLASDRQRRLFAERAGEMAAQFHGSALRHEAKQYHAYALSVRQGATDNAVNSIGLFYNDPARIRRESTTIRASIFDAARLSGKSAEWAEAQTREVTSKAHVGALSAALEHGNVDYARRYIETFGGEMAADDLLKAQGVLDKASQQRTAYAVASEVVGQAHAESGDFGRLWRLLTNQESGGHQFRADGSVVTSNKGARGIAQVMPGTWEEARKLAGLPDTASIDNPEHNEAAGQAYFKQQLQTFGGDIAKALAAYNMGPGSAAKGNGVAGLVAKYGDDWLSHAPAQTRDYVARITSRYHAGMGAAPAPSLEDMQRQAVARLGKDADPETVKATLQETARQFEVIQKGRRAEEGAAESEAYRTLFANGGDLGALSPSLLAKVPGDKLDTLRNFAGKLAKGEEPKTDWRLYADLMGEAATAPEKFAARDLTLEASRLAKRELKQLIERQAKVKGGNEGQYHVASEEGQISAIASELKLSKQERGQFTAAAIRELQAATARNGGKRVSPDEERKILDRLVMQGEVPGGAWYRNDQEGRAFKFYGTPDAGRFVPDISDEDRQRIESDLRAAGIAPTPERIVRQFNYEKSQ